MEQIRKGILKFDVFKAYAAFGMDAGMPLGNPASVGEFLDRTRVELDGTLGSPHFLFGQRTESMFAGLVLSLGQAKFLKQEDEGDCFTSSGPLEIPDFRVVLPNDQHWLIEVKNYHHVNPKREYRMKAAYLDGLEAYAKLMRCPLKIAVYWVRWGLWSVFPSQFMTREGEWASIALGEAMMHNELSALGDLNVGTTAPLRLTQFFAETSEPVLTDGALSFRAKVDRLELSCGGRIIEETVEKNIALYLMFFGKWNLESTPRRDGNRIVAVDHEWRPEESADQGFDIVGSLSDMYSRYYRMTTSDFAANAIKQIHVKPAPGVLGKLIPKDYKGKALRLWLLTMQAKHWKEPAERPPRRRGGR